MSKAIPNAPILDAVNAYLARNPARFHMPGHGGNASALPLFAGALPYDLTELPGLDSLYDAAGCIAASERFAAEVFGAKATLYSAGGSTLAIQTMLALVSPGGGSVIFARNLHRAALAACILLDLDPVFLPLCENGAAEPESVGRALRAYPDARAVCITSPDYLGRLCDIGGIAKICGGHGVPLLVDAAHGAHLRFVSPALDPLALGASLCANSAHKTLPALTPGAFLHIGDARFIPDAKRKMALFGSTSPSYPVLLSLEQCCAWLSDSGETAFAALREKTARLREDARALGLDPLERDCDPVRLTLDTAKSGTSGRRTGEILRSRGISCEYADGRYAVFILTPFHTDADLARLRAGLEAVAGARGEERSPGPGASMADFAPPALSMRVRDAYFAESVTVPAANSAGKIAAEAACPCPPGVPIVVPGEKISEKAAFLLKGYGISQIKVVK